MDRSFEVWRIYALRVEQSYGFDDVYLVPQRSELKGRMDVDLSSELLWVKMGVPIFSAPMDTVTEYEMAAFMRANGGLGILHRYLSIDEQAAQARKLVGDRPDLHGGEYVAASVGVNGDSWERVDELYEAGVGIFVLDVAHGHTKAALDFTYDLASNYTDAIIISGNIVTAEAARDYRSAGVNALRVGIGGGAACETRTVAGVGMPQLSAISEVHQSVPNLPVISCGGHRTSGDIVKALAAGATYVILGRMLAGYDCAAGEHTPSQKVFRGMASAAALEDYKGRADYVTEGRETMVELIKDPTEHFSNLVNQIKLGLSYLGAENIPELQENARWVST